MKHRIDPRIDCVFKALLGAEENGNLLLHFLNAVLAAELQTPLIQVEILNPYNEKEFLADKLSIVDVKAQDHQHRLFQIEIQLLNYRHLPARMVYTWADIYSQQLRSGEDYGRLEATYGIWLLAENLITDDNAYAHHYKWRDERGQVLLEHGGIWLLELEKCPAERIDTEEQRWLKLFREGRELDDAALPDWMNTDEMRQVMDTLKRFSEKDREYFAYQARENFLREQRTILKEREEVQRALDEAQQTLAREREHALTREREAEQALAREREAEQALVRERQLAEREREEKAAALAEIERLKALLRQR